MRLQVRIATTSWPLEHRTVEASGPTIGRALRDLAHRLRHLSSNFIEGALAYVPEVRTFYQLSRASSEPLHEDVVLEVASGSGRWIRVEETVKAPSGRGRWWQEDGDYDDDD